MVAIAQLYSPFNSFQKIDISSDTNSAACSVMTLNTDYTYVQGNERLLLETSGSLIYLTNNSINFYLSNSAGYITFNPSTYHKSDILLDNSAGIKFGSGYSEIGGGEGSSVTLDTYEEGTWNPSFVSENGYLTITGGERCGNYVKIGKLVTCYGAITTYAANILNANAGQIAELNAVQIAGLPFTVKSLSNYFNGSYPDLPGRLSTSKQTGFAGNPNHIYGALHDGDTKVNRLHYSYNDSTYINGGQINNQNVKFWFMITYISDT